MAHNVSPAFANTLVMGRRSIGVVALDGKIPNLAIMKIVGYHEALGDEVRWYDGLMFAETYDKIYMSKIFAFTPMPQMPPNAVIGGTEFILLNKAQKHPSKINS